MLVVEPVRGEDVDGVAKLAARSLQERYDGEWLTLHAVSKGGTFLVARDVPTNRVLGFALARHEQAEGHLLALAVDSQHRGKGIGAALLRGVRNDLSRDGAMALKLDVRADDVRSRQYYQRHGFLPVGLEPNVYADGEDAILMTRPL